MNSDGTYNLADLRYAATARCRCGAGLAYVASGENAAKPNGSWFCGDWLLGRAPVEDGCASRGIGGNSGATAEEIAATKHDAYPFIFFDIKSEAQPSAEGATTRPPA